MTQDKQDRSVFWVHGYDFAGAKLYQHGVWTVDITMTMDQAEGLFYAMWSAFGDEWLESALTSEGYKLKECQ